jgi:hypothetical protein
VETIMVGTILVVKSSKNEITGWQLQYQLCKMMPKTIINLNNSCLVVSFFLSFFFFAAIALHWVLLLPMIESTHLKNFL